MNSNPQIVRALGLCSGGLDSILSALILRRQNIEVEWVSFETPFFSAKNAKKASLMTGIPLTVKDITTDYLVMLKNPPCGYGKNMNPCMDCHTLMFRQAGKLMTEKGFDFLFSGEVLGQRPMSQTKPSLRYVAKHSGFDGYVLRPLSAGLLPETIPESKGMVDRNLLLNLSGRSRKPQIQLAKKLGITEYPAPAGGCLLTDKIYSIRLKDLFEHQEDYTENELYLLKYGRHLRLDKNTKAVIGRMKEDNENIERYYNPAQDTIIKVELFPGPVCILPNGGKKEITTLAASICAGYSKAPLFEPARVIITAPRGKETITVLGIPPADIKGFLIQ